MLQFVEVKTAWLASFLCAGMLCSLAAASTVPPQGPYLSSPAARPPSGDTTSWNQRLNAGGVQVVRNNTPGGEWPSFETAESAVRHGLCGGAAGEMPSFTTPSAPSVAWRAGSIATMQVVLRSDVGGHFEFRICEQPEVSYECFSSNVLQRAEKDASVISNDFFDPTYPERFYVPAVAGTYSARYKIPESLNCTEHCVLQWYVVRVQTCIPPGYSSLELPASYNVETNLPRCGQDGHYPEEYWACSDISVLRPVSEKSKCKEADGIACKRVVGYITNWATYRTKPWNFDMTDTDASKYTHLIYAFASMSRDYHLVEGKHEDIHPSGQGLYAQFHKRVAKTNKACKTLLSIGGATFNENSNTKFLFSNMVADVTNRATFITSAVSWLRRHSFDGLDLDWEFPGQVARGGTASDKQNFVKLVRELRQAFKDEAASTGRSELLLSMAVSADLAVAADAYNIGVLHLYVDWFHVMAYNYKGYWNPTTGFHSALFSDDGYSIDATLQFWLGNGVPREQLVLGVATHGRGWTLSNPADNGNGASANGASRPLPYTQEAGLISFFEVQALLETQGYTATYDRTAKTMYATDGDQWFSYDNPYTMSIKAQYVTDNSLGGVMLWTVDQDDFNNGYPLVSAVRSSMVVPEAADPEKDKGIHTIHYTLIVVGGAAGGVVLLFFLYMLVSRNQHFEEVDLRLSPGEDERFAPVPAIYTQASLKALIKKGDQLTQAEAEVLNTYFDSGDACLEEVVRKEEEDDLTEDEDEEEIEVGLTGRISELHPPSQRGTFSARAMAQQHTLQFRRTDGDNASLDWEPEVEA